MGKAPFGQRNTMTFIATLRHDRIEAPWLLDGPINGERFRIYVEQVLVPTLLPGDVVIMDNLGSHKGQPVRRAIRQAGAKLLLLPKYSPDLNPIEQVFSKLKHIKKVFLVLFVHKKNCFLPKKNAPHNGAFFMLWTSLGARRSIA